MNYSMARHTMMLDANGFGLSNIRHWFTGRD
jgi:hypothetical protein